MIVKDLLEIKIGHKVTADDDKAVIANVLLRQFYSTGRSIIIIRNHIGDLDAEITAVFEIIFDDLRFKIEQNNKFRDPKIFEIHHRVFHHRSVDDR